MKLKKAAGVLAAALCISMAFTSLSTQAKSKKETLTYSNLYDSSTQKQVKRQLIKAGVSKTNVSCYMNYVKKYNRTLPGIPLAKKGFKTTAMKQPAYDEYTAYEKWMSKTNNSDSNCRLNAYTLLKGRIKTASKFKGSDGTIFLDLDTIKTLPMKNFSKSDVVKFQNIYGDIPVKKRLSPKDGAKAVNRYWKKNKVTFHTGKNVSMINIFQYFDLDNILFTGHAGILVNTGKGYLFLEKYGPTLPYQASRFANKTELYRYLMNRLDVGDGRNSVGSFIMENNRLIDPAKIPQTFRSVSVKSGKYMTKNSEITTHISKRADLKISIYNRRGKLAARYTEKSISPVEPHTLHWNGKTTKGNQLGLSAGKYVFKGAYYAKITSGGKTIKTKSFRIK